MKAEGRVRYYNNREVSQILDIKLSRWKRWSREFLAPDPLGGIQSGYARQLTIDDAFTVYLGGHLVSELKYGIQSAKQILGDLHLWLGAGGFYKTPIYRSADEHNDHKVLAYQIYIEARGPLFFGYTIRGIMEERVASAQVGCMRTVRYWEQVLGTNKAPGSDQVTGDGVHLLNITSVHARFLQRFGQAKYR